MTTVAVISHPQSTLALNVGDIEKYIDDEEE